MNQSAPTISLFRFYKILALLCLLPGVCFGQGAHRIGQVFSRGSGVSANIVPFASILVCPAGTNCNTTSSLFSNIALTITKPNPVIADSNGVYDYYATPACYDEHISAPGITAYTVFNVCSVNGSGSGPTLQTNGTNNTDQTLLNLVAGTNVTLSNSGGAVTINATGGGGSCPDCVITDPNATQSVNQPQGTNLNVNNLEGMIWADQYGTGSNGIETAYAQCLAQNGLGYSGCSIFVSQNYTNADAPNGWPFNSSYYSNIPMQVPSGGAVYDQRNGTQYWLFHNPLNPITGQGTGLALTTQFDVSTAASNAVVQGPNRTGIYNLVNVLNGGSEFNYYISGIPQYLSETYTYGTYDVLNNYIGGINFLHYGYENCRSNGDCYLDWKELTADAGILSGNSEGDAAADIGVREDPDVFTGTVTGSPSTGANQVHVSATIGAQTQGGMYRWLVNQSSPLATGTKFTGLIPEETTGPAGNSAIMPPAVIDSTQNFPVSTLLQICYSGSDNGASGATGCTSGSQPVGYIPSQNYRLTITGGSVTSGVATFAITPTSPQTTPVHLAVGQVVMLYGFPLTGNGAFLNQQSVTVLSAGLSTTQFEANVTGPDTTSIGTGYSTYSPTGYSPAQSISVGIVPAYTTGGGTGGLPSGFCTPSTVQTSNPSAACYLPTSGVGCVTDQIEIEPVSYTYSSGTGLITLDNLQFPHLNGAIFAVGGYACKSIEDVSSQYTSGGTSGVIDEVYPVAGSLNATTVYYVPQRTNLGYASPPLGGSTDGGSDNGGINSAQQTALCFSASMSNFSLIGGVVSFAMGNIAGASNPYSYYNNLTVAIAANGDASYNGNYKLTITSETGFKYTPTAPTGTTPTSGTVSHCNANYKVLDAARVLNVLNPSNNAVDGTFNLFPNAASFSGATVREPHFQQMNMNGTHETVTQFQPKTFIGINADSISYAGNISGPGWGLTINNNGASSSYLGGGGTFAPPFQALGLYGVWLDSMQVTAPQQSVINVTGWNLAGPSSSLSTFGLVQFPTLPNAFAGYGLDSLCYNPFYNYSVRGNALTTGEYIFGNAIGANCGDGPANGNLVSTVRMGHGIMDLDLSVPEITAKDVSVTQLSNTPSNAPLVIGLQTGSTCYDYEIVSHDKNGGSTVPQGPIGGANPCSINNGQAALNGTNFNRICAFLNPGVVSYDFLKEVGGVYQSLATNVAVGNGASYSQVPNYTCVNDQGGTTTAYTMPTQNTTGSISAATIAATSAITAPQFTLASGPTWTSGSTAPSGACTSGSLYTNSSGSPNTLYVCQVGAWVGK